MNKKKGLSKKNTKPSKNLTADEKDLRIQELEYELGLAKIKNEYLEILGSLGQKEEKKQESSINSEIRYQLREILATTGFLKSTYMYWQ